MAEEYQQHNPHVADGDHIILHCHQTWPGSDDYAGIDIFRLDPEGKVVEHWDVLQAIPVSSARDPILNPLSYPNFAYRFTGTPS